MDKEIVERFKGKKIQICLKSQMRYTGYILELFESSLIMRDKFELQVAVAYSEIERIEEQREES